MNAGQTSKVENTSSTTSSSSSSSHTCNRSNPSTHLEEPHHELKSQDDGLDDPLDLLSPRAATRKLSCKRYSNSLLNPIIDLPSSNQIEPVTPQSPDLELLFDQFNQLALSKPLLNQDQSNEVDRPHQYQRKWPKNLTPTQQIVVEEALKPKNQSISYEIDGASCGIKELEILSSSHRWFNDEIINFYAMLINLSASNSSLNHSIRTSSSKLLNVHCFSSFLFSQFQLGGHQAVKRWTKKVNLFEKQLVLFPINLTNLHWVLGVINNRFKRFEYYDSLGGHNPDVISGLRRYYKDEYKAKKDMEVDLNDWTDYQPKVPLQSNSSDCGLFICQYMYSLSRDLEKPRRSDHLKDQEPCNPFDFTAENMTYLRQKLAFEIITKQLIPDESYLN